MLLPYFAQLAKVFSQGNYYVGGPRKVQICRNCLLTNTLIMHFCLFIVVNNCCLSRNINSTCAPIWLFTVTVSTRECPSLASSLSKQIPHLLTYLLTPWSRVFLEKLTVNFATSQEIPRIYGTRKSLTVPTSVRHLSLS
jgi:hypothetical protein